MKIFTMLFMKILMVQMVVLMNLSVAANNEGNYLEELLMNEAGKTYLTNISAIGPSIIRGSEAINSDCINDYSTSWGGLNFFDFPSIDDLLNKFKDKLCDYANKAIAGIYGGAQAKIDSVVNGLNGKLGPIGKISPLKVQADKESKIRFDKITNIKKLTEKAGEIYDGAGELIRSKNTGQNQSEPQSPQQEDWYQ